jgi:hypothetical protein
MREVLALQHAYIAKKGLGSPTNSTKTSGTLQSGNSFFDGPYSSEEFNPFKPQGPHMKSVPQESLSACSLTFPPMVQLPQPFCQASDLNNVEAPMIQPLMENNFSSEEAQRTLLIQ